MKNNRYWPLAIAVVIALIMLFSPGSTVPSSPENTDKITHT
ncbi:MAG: putative rane protein, partial [Rhodococcus erythropolis]|nr:putative rane protein [Rhodococcus erythropolis]